MFWQKSHDSWVQWKKLSLKNRPTLTLISKSWKNHPEFFPKFRFSGVWHRQISGKLIQYFFEISISRAWARPYYWKIHPSKFSSNTVWLRPWNALCHLQKTEISEQLMDAFSCSCPGNSSIRVSYLPKLPERSLISSCVWTLWRCNLESFRRATHGQE